MNSLAQDDQFNSIHDILVQYDTLQDQYITMKSTEKFLDNMINEPSNIQYDTEIPLSCEEIVDEFQHNKQLFIDEIIEYRKGK